MRVTSENARMAAGKAGSQYHRAPEWCGHQDGKRYAGALLRWLYPRHLYPCHHLGTERSCPDYGKHTKYIKYIFSLQELVSRNTRKHRQHTDWLCFLKSERKPQDKMFTTKISSYFSNTDCTICTFTWARLKKGTELKLRPRSSFIRNSNWISSVR